MMLKIKSQLISACDTISNKIYGLKFSLCIKLGLDIAAANSQNSSMFFVGKVLAVGLTQSRSFQ